MACFCRAPSQETGSSHKDWTQQTQAKGTHHLGAADDMEPARDSALAARPDVVLELEGRTL